jgi:hypothetical protein
MRWAAVALTIAAVTTSAAAAANTVPAQQIEVSAIAQHSNTAPLPPKGRAGNATSSHWVVRDRYGRDIGDMLTDCRWVTAGLRLCVGQLSLPRGALAVIGASRTTFLGQFIVAGGTGRYIGANGVLTFNEISAGRYVLAVTYQKEQR